MIDTTELRHTGFDADTPHHCEPRVFAAFICRVCGSEATGSERFIKSGGYICRPCRTQDRIRRLPKYTARNLAFVNEINAATVCAHCGAQPIEWHNPEHVELKRRDYRISAMARRGNSIEAIKTEMARCTPLCRRCHMVEDGRLKAFLVHRRHDLPQPPKPCKDCSRPFKPLRKGRCHSCDRKNRKTLKAAENTAMDQAIVHSPGTLIADHRCEPRVWALCRRCGRRVVWCRMTVEEIAAITARRYVCNDCLEIGR